MAASSPSEYEKPPIGNAGDASHISCSNAGVEAGAAMAASVVMVAMGAMDMAMCVVAMSVVMVVPVVMRMTMRAV